MVKKQVKYSSAFVIKNDKSEVTRIVLFPLILNRIEQGIMQCKTMC